MCLPPTTHRTQACLQRKQDMRISHQDVSDTICFHPLRGCLLSILVHYSYLHFKEDKKCIYIKWSSSVPPVVLKCHRQQKHTTKHCVLLVRAVIQHKFKSNFAPSVQNGCEMGHFTWKLASFIISCQGSRALQGEVISLKLTIGSLTMSEIIHFLNFTLKWMVMVTTACVIFRPPPSSCLDLLLLFSYSDFLQRPRAFSVLWEIQSHAVCCFLLLESFVNEWFHFISGKMFSSVFRYTAHWYVS